MKVLHGIVLSILSYLATSAFLVLIIHACVPGELAPDGRIVGRWTLLLDLAAQAAACFAAGAVALVHAEGRVGLATLAMGGVLLALVLGLTLGFWSLAPAWYNLSVIAVTLPFVALGAACRRAARPTAVPFAGSGAQ